MRKISLIAPALAVACGGAGFLVRSMELRDAFDAQTGLAIAGAPSSAALIVLSAVFTAVIAVFALRLRSNYRSPGGFENAFGTETLVYPVVSVLVGALWFAAAVFRFASLSPEGAHSLAEMLFLGLSALSAISVPLFAIAVYLRPGNTAKRALSVVPTVFMLLWLIIFYRDSAANPVLLDVCYKCLALVFVSLGFYSANGYAFDRPSPGKAVFSYLGSVYFCLVTLADEAPAHEKLLFAAIVIINIIHVFMLIRNLRAAEPGGSRSAGFE